MTEERNIDLSIPVLARVEGEGGLDLVIKSGQIEDLKLRIFEPPRMFEKFLEGRSYAEVPDIVARICGICPVAYQITAVQALEKLFVVQPNSWVNAMRRVFYCGEWIESHCLHIHLLALPDFFGFANGIQMAEKYPDEVKRGLMLQKVGNDLIRLFGGRSVHPVGLVVGGFSRAPLESEVKTMIEKLNSAIPEAEALLAWLAQIELPDVSQDFVNVALSETDQYAICSGLISSSHGLAIDAEEFEQHFQEHQVPHSTALHCLLDGEPYMVGPLARMNLNSEKLPDVVQKLMKQYQIQFPSANPFHSLLARGIEVYFALIEARRLLEAYAYPAKASVEVVPQKGVSASCSEAPRGILWQRYEVDDQGDLVSARIVPPTSQNQARIEADLKFSIEKNGLHLDDAALRLYAETVIRNYDPCISCATHFLDLRVERG